jgi:hypothetical protein
MEVLWPLVFGELPRTGERDLASGRPIVHDKFGEKHFYPSEDMQAYRRAWSELRVEAA